MDAIHRNLLQRTNRLQKALDIDKTRQAVIQDYDFKITATCPPSTSIYIRAGKAWRDATYWAVIGYNVEKPSVTVNLAEEKIMKYDWPTPTEVLDLSFVNPYYYKALIFGYNMDWIFYEQYGEENVRGQCKFFYLAADTEHQTAAQAEAQVDLMLNGGLGGGYSGQGMYSEYMFLLWSIILRNNGTLGTAGQIMSIEPLNRGQSYLYRDIRPGKNFIIA